MEKKMETAMMGLYRKGPALDPQSFLYGSSEINMGMYQQNCLTAVIKVSHKLLTFPIYLLGFKGPLFEKLLSSRLMALNLQGGFMNLGPLLGGSPSHGFLRQRGPSTLLPSTAWPTRTWAEAKTAAVRVKLAWEKWQQEQDRDEKNTVQLLDKEKKAEPSKARP